MSDNNITMTTPVNHPDGGNYRLQSVASIEGEAIVVDIIKIGYGHVFKGSPKQAREQGFAFDVEYTNDADIEALLAPEEPTPSAMRQAWLACEEANRTLSAELEARSGTISDLRGEVMALNGDTATLRSRLNGSERALTEFKERVRNEVESAKKEHDLCIDGCNSFLEELGLPLLTRTWKGTVTRDSDYEVLLTVTGIKADSEDDAQEHLRENFTVKATVKRVDYDYSYDGEGAEDWDSEDYTDSDLDDDDDNFADCHKDALTFTVEEE